MRYTLMGIERGKETASGNVSFVTFLICRWVNNYETVYGFRKFTSKTEKDCGTGTGD